jgi:hypothetical protein
MSDRLTHFSGNAVALPCALDERLSQWEALRKEMVRGVPDAFTRDEWAYLVAFLDTEHLRGIFTRTFGREGLAPVRSLWRPRGPVAIWLPNNVSLLGPLVLILATFAGQPIRVKTGSRSDEVCGAFSGYALSRLPPGELRDYWQQAVEVHAFDRHDPRNAQMAAQAAVRIAFGSDASVLAIHALPHSVASVGIGFGNRRSEAWIEPEALTDANVDTLLKVFAIYGQAGCTSPRRVVILDGAQGQAVDLRERMLQRWSQAVKRQPLMHTASENIMAWQVNLANGWDAVRAPRHAAVLGVGALDRGEMHGLMSLPITWGSLDGAAQDLPGNIQTIGYLGHRSEELLPVIARTRVVRFVPAAQMHNFGPVWDGSNFWSQLFEQTTLTQ